MTDKEIENKAYELYPLLRRNLEQQRYNDGGWDGFVKGALWTQEQVIEKACKWLLNNEIANMSELQVKFFRKAMEE